MEELSERIRTDAALKGRKSVNYLQYKGLDGLLISTREHFAWVTGGGGQPRGL